MPAFTLVQRWTHLFGPDSGGNDSPDSLAKKVNGSDGNGAELETAALSHTNPLRETSSLDSGFTSVSEVPQGHNEGNTALLFHALVAGNGVADTMAQMMKDGNANENGGVGDIMSKAIAAGSNNKNAEAKVESIRRAGINVVKLANLGRSRLRSSVRSLAHTRGNQRLGEVDVNFDQTTIAAASDEGLGNRNTRRMSKMRK